VIAPLLSAPGGNELLVELQPAPAGMPPEGVCPVGMRLFAHTPNHPPNSFVKVPYRPEIRSKSPLFLWLVRPLALDAADSPPRREAAVQMAASTGLEEVRAGSQRRATEHLNPVAGVSRSRSNALIFHYLPPFARGLASAPACKTSPKGAGQPGSPERWTGVGPRDQPDALRPLKEPRFDQDLQPSTPGNLEKMAKPLVDRTKPWRCSARRQRARLEGKL